MRQQKMFLKYNLPKFEQYALAAYFIATLGIALIILGKAFEDKHLLIFLYALLSHVSLYIIFNRLIRSIRENIIWFGIGVIHFAFYFLMSVGKIAYNHNLSTTLLATIPLLIFIQAERYFFIKYFNKQLAIKAKSSDVDIFNEQKADFKDDIALLIFMIFTFCIYLILW